MKQALTQALCTLVTLFVTQPVFSAITDMADSSDAPINAETPQSKPLKSFSAVLRVTHEPSATVLDESRLLVSQAGIRIDQTIDSAANSLIVNYQSDQLWFLDRAHRLVHEVPIKAVSTETLKHSDTDVHPMFGFIQFQACRGFKRDLEEHVVENGRALERWTCAYGGRELEQQWFSLEYGVVIRTESYDGFVSELGDIRHRDFVDTTFQPPSGYRSVSVLELLNQAEPIGSYAEPPDL